MSDGKRDGDRIQVKVSIEHQWVSPRTGQWCFFYVDGQPVLGWEGDVR